MFDLSLRNAFAGLKQAARSALVFADGQSYSLFFAADIAIAIAERSSDTLSGVERRTALISLPLFEFPRGFLDFRDTGLAARVEHFLDSQKQRYALVAISTANALIVSRQETDMFAIQASPVDCYCTADRKPVSSGVSGGNCPHDYSHMGTVRCC
ncbi:hypothetical protein FTO74_10725 [Granulicella sp. WH15]|uniref:hypothetical protein n=1 Tax=Granulicella sp. WH15 TaxID=2602070 RepID=UPI0013673606|nr:hypothetical protein [Granulicella sp. WH15]QHN03795.1 hypothetical protein FTO74_10725 [Granulicella sp. WH15]